MNWIPLVNMVMIKVPLMPTTNEPHPLLAALLASTDTLIVCAHAKLQV
jgi:hypothetical protein